jgi:hypothetical protein
VRDGTMWIAEGDDRLFGFIVLVDADDHLPYDRVVRMPCLPCAIRAERDLPGPGRPPLRRSARPPVTSLCVPPCAPVAGIDVDDDVASPARD